MTPPPRAIQEADQQKQTEAFLCELAENERYWQTASCCSSCSPMACATHSSDINTIARLGTQKLPYRKNHGFRLAGHYGAEDNDIPTQA